MCLRPKRVTLILAICLEKRKVAPDEWNRERTKLRIPFQWKAIEPIVYERGCDMHWLGR